MSRAVPLLCILSACVPDDLCDETRTIEGHVSTAKPVDPVAADVRIEGTLVETDVPIARVWAARGPEDDRQQVAVATAKVGAFNFEQWEMTLPLAAFAASAGEDEVSFEIIATDACSGGRARDIPIDTFAAPTSTPTDVTVTNLALTVEFEGTDRCYVPANGSGEATVTLTAAASSVGGLVRLRASAGEFSGAALDDAGRLPLEPGAGNATASVGFFAEGEGDATATIRASAPGSLDVKHVVEIAAKPALDAAASQIPAGGHTTLIATSSGILATCEATATTTAVTATVREQSSTPSLLDGPVPVGSRTCPAADEEVEHSFDAATIDVTFLDSATTDTLVRIVCRDTYNQESDAVVITLADESG
jgi:hypothetical protein